MRPDLLRGPGLAREVRYAKVDKLLNAAILEFTVGVTPFAVVLIERAVRLAAGCAVLERHPAALADKAPRGTQQGIDRNIEEFGKLLERFQPRRCLPGIT